MTSHILETIFDLQNDIVNSLIDRHFVVVLVIVDVNLNVIVQLNEKVNHSILDTPDCHNINLIRLGNSNLVEIVWMNKLMVSQFCRSLHTGGVAFCIV